MENCIFCKIIEKKIPSYIIDEDDKLIVLLSLENHPLIVPKSHITDIFSLDNEIGALIMKKAIKIAKATKDGLNCDGIYLAQANGKAAGQDVFHYHLHLYPKWNNKEENHLAEKKEILVSKIKAKL